MICNMHSFLRLPKLELKMLLKLRKRTPINHLLLLTENEATSDNEDFKSANEEPSTPSASANKKE
jgi:hypothetical protein